MKRDMDLIRELLIDIEEDPTFDGKWHDWVLPGHTQAELCYHVLLAKEAGLIEARVLPNTTIFNIKRLTYEGHEFLEAARDQNRWTKAKDTVVKSTGALTLEALKTVLGLLMKQALTGGM